MARIRISRRNDWFGKDLPLKVFIDNEFAGSVKWSDYRDFKTTEGVHNLRLKISAYNKEFDVEVSENKPSIFIIRLPNFDINPLRLLVKWQRGMDIQTTSTDTRAEKYS